MSGRGTPMLGQTEVLRCSYIDHGGSDIIPKGGSLAWHAPVPLQGRAGDDDDGRRLILVSKRKVQALSDKVKR